jgi:hypothetical protein
MVIDGKFVEHQQYIGVSPQLLADYQDALELTMIDLITRMMCLPPSCNETRQRRVLVLSESLRAVIERRLRLKANSQL